jgi:hypothetical protein
MEDIMKRTEKNGNSGMGIFQLFNVAIHHVEGVELRGEKMQCLQEIYKVIDKRI